MTMEKTNHMYFDDKRQALKFIKELINISLEDILHFCDIHVYTEEQAVIVDFVQVPYSGEWGGRFTYVDSDNDEEVVLRKSLPDGSYDYYYTEEEFKEVLANWLKEHPKWKQNQYGRWYEEDEQF